ncbi:TetR family transcriptional regulator [Halieaceae bacterium IMCC14734]|uniref:TetR family transcriptional regulator n=2 Tax=Candidatus Litorirhabdus singularis TaxID=2518993 RepID=A0ABT3TKL1_9GAMM|nr:TetR family transcriptional regulator [Candidatus Litorirhabdus singularis]
MFTAAIELINERGTQKTTLKDIGERAGYSRGMANYRFGSKEGLMMELFAQFDQRWKAHLSEYLEGHSGISAVIQAANALREFLKLESDYMRAMYLLWYESLGHQSDMRSTLAEHHDVYRSDARRWIEQGIAAGEIRPDINAEQFAVQYCSFIFGVVYQWLVNADALDLDAAFDSYEQLTVQLLRSQE